MNKFFKNLIIFKIIMINLLYLPSALFSQDIQAISAIVNDEVISRYDEYTRLRAHLS